MLANVQKQTPQPNSILDKYPSIIILTNPNPTLLDFRLNDL